MPPCTNSKYTKLSCNMQPKPMFFESDSHTLFECVYRHALCFVIIFYVLIANVISTLCFVPTYLIPKFTCTFCFQCATFSFHMYTLCLLCSHYTRYVINDMKMNNFKYERCIESQKKNIYSMALSYYIELSSRRRLWYIDSSTSARMTYVLFWPLTSSIGNLIALTKWEYWIVADLSSSSL